MSKKVAVVTLYADRNYGNKLQNYAVQCYFENRGYTVETIPYWERDHIVYSLRSLLYYVRENLLHKDSKIEERERIIRSFSSDYIKLGEEVHYRKLNEDLPKKYDYFVTGSDQVWHCWSGEREELEFFFLKFARPEQRITIAPSFGFKSFPSKFTDVYEEGLRGFKFINCREREAADLIKSLTGQETTVILDPTMLIQTSEWKKILRKPTNFCNGKYVMTYILGALPGDFEKALKQYCNENSLELINLMDNNEKYYISTRPDEFLYWINNADFVVTDSFHATVFSILFKKNFITLSRHNEPGMENRIDTLLDTFSLQDRKFKTDGTCKYYSEGELKVETLYDTDFSNVEQVLLSEREKADLFYKKCMM